MNIINPDKIVIVSTYRDQKWEISDDSEGLKIRCHGSWYLLTESKGKLQLNKIEGE